MFRSAEPEIAQMWQHSEQLRYDGMAVVTRALLAKRKPRPGLTAEQATDIVFVLLSADTYQAFVVQRGWSAEAWRAWTASALVSALFAAPSRAR